MSDCSVCTEPFTTVLRTKITCGTCSYSACKTCVTRYLLSQVADAHCMSCRTGWNREFMDQHMTKTFRTGLWREHRKKMIVIREKSLLPNFQMYAAAKLNINKLLPQLLEAKKDETDYSSILNTNSMNIFNLKRAMILDPSKDDEHIEQLHKYLSIHSTQTIDHTVLSVKADRIQTEYNYYLNIYDGLVKKDVEKREFIMKCVREGCRGFLSKAYKCELCSTFVCKDCLVIKKERDDVEHVCKKEDVDTVALIRKDTRPCPKCAIRISKIDGCDQMWCTAEGCGTAFSWDSGKIISGVIHNPHYYEWMRRNGAGELARNPGDVPCGGVPQLHLILTAARTLGFNLSYNPTSDYTKISQIHRCLTDLEHVRIPHYNVVRDENLLKEFHVDYLLGKIDTAKWTQSIYLKETNLEKKQCVAQVLNTFLTAGSDLMRTVAHILSQMLKDKTKNPHYKLDKPTLKPIHDTIYQLETLRTYINETLEKLAESVSTPVPQFDELFYYINPSSSDRIKAIREAELRESAKVKEVTTT